MFGAYQAGAWQVLAKCFRPDIVVGASVGALNGWAIAGGCPPEELIGQWLNPGWAPVAGRRWAPPWRGMLDGAALHQAIRRLWSQYRPRSAVAVVVTDLVRLQPRLFCNDEIRWQHLAASCAAPFCYPLVRVEGRLYADGGLLAPAPVWAAVAMGATRVVLVHLLARPASRLLGAAMRALRTLVPAGRRAPHNAAILTIAPHQPLGRLRDSLLWNATNIERWIEQGRRDARQVLEALQRFP